MANPKNRQQVEDALRLELERDRTKTYVVEISPLGLVEMTRQNVTDGPREVMTRKCPTCDGDGIIVSDGTAAVEVERKLRALVTPGLRSKAFMVELNPKIAALIVGPDGSRLAELEEVTKKRFFFTGLEDAHLDHVRVVAQGTVEKLTPVAPVEVGQEIELKLGELGLHDARSGAGKVDGFEVVVADAAKLVGKKVKVRIVAIMDGVAVGALVEAPKQVDPITAEAEAEKPTRAVRRTTKAAVTGEAVDADADAEGEEAALEADDAAEEPAPRRPARRTSTRKPAVAAGADADADEETAEEAVEKPAPRPRRTRKPAVTVEADADADADGEAESNTDAAGEAGDETPGTPRKRTRRGTRGGRNRKRKPALAADGDTDAAADSDVAADEVEPANEPADVDEVEVEEENGSGPVIHLPGRDLGRDGDDSEDGETPTPRKTTRRGSRGGRNRKRKPVGDTVGESDAPDAEHDGDSEAVATVEKEPIAADESPGDDWEYTPMSEWDRD
jgi:ribonuclease G